MQRELQHIGKTSNTRKDDICDLFKNTIEGRWCNLVIIRDDLIQDQIEELLF